MIFPRTFASWPPTYPALMIHPYILPTYSNHIHTIYSTHTTKLHTPPIYSPTYSTHIIYPYGPPTYPSLILHPHTLPSCSVHITDPYATTTYPTLMLNPHTIPACSDHTPSHTHPHTLLS
ncbi:hypothetical protein DPMN_139725 [Dreissena polymorpha]|uniref:Uncharacterized protein n=1 Tax=Dreissena polymorpha TaxID=45954 RepID=A0A9D4G696_DREPO|nr:hypothetical protein DPMN_139725 [Dreissena polymorpha]